MKQTSAAHMQEIFEALNVRIVWLSPLRGRLQRVS
jgi:hypothetical protein